MYNRVLTTMLLTNNQMKNTKIRQKNNTKIILTTISKFKNTKVLEKTKKMNDDLDAFREII